MAPGPLHDRRRLLGSRVGAWGTEDGKEWKRSRKCSHSSNLQLDGALPPSHRSLPPLLLSCSWWTETPCLTPDRCSHTTGKDNRGKGGDGVHLEETGPTGLSARSRANGRRTRRSTRPVGTEADRLPPGASVGVRRHAREKHLACGAAPGPAGNFADCLPGPGGGD